MPQPPDELATPRIKAAAGGAPERGRLTGRAAARYVVRILSGTHRPDLPVERIDRPAFAINLKTARALGITVPDLLLVCADEVIESPHKREWMLFSAQTISF